MLKFTTTNKGEEMEDRELLEMAAKAAGHEWRWYGAPLGTLFQIKTHSRIWIFWNPLTDDGDALRLATALKLHILHNDLGDALLWVSAVLNKRGLHGVVDFDDESQRANATRRAIVLAAAEIGKLLA